MSPRPEHFVIPELCNTTALALLILFSQLLVVILIFAGGEISWIRFGLMSLFVQWIALASAGLLCTLRKYLSRLGLVAGSLAAFGVVMLVTGVMGYVAELLVNRGPGMGLRLTGQLIIAGIITALVLRYFYVQQRLRLQEQAELESRIQALQSRIRPHFLFNSMNIIASLIAVDPDTAETVVEDLSELFRASLNDAGNQVPLSDELALCERYLRIEGLRLGERLQLDWEVDAPTDDIRIPLLTLQPLLENAVYHGIQPLPEGGIVKVRVKADDQMAHIDIENPIPAAPAQRESEGNRMALQNIRSRLSVLYGDAAELATHDQGDCFATTLRFPKIPPVL